MGYGLFSVAHAQLTSQRPGLGVLLHMQDLDGYVVVHFFSRISVISFISRLIPTNRAPIGGAMNAIAIATIAQSIISFILYPSFRWCLVC